jgi:lysozyme family protein
MRQNYPEALRQVLKHEGGYTNHPSDPGGPTNFGITIHDYRKYINAKGTASDVRAMNIEDAKKIYRAKYWDIQKCDELPPGVDFAIFDYGVNSGVGRSGKVLRRRLGLPDNTHVVTAAVVAAAKRANAAALVNAICDERLAFLKRLKTWPTFGKGWGRRVSEVRAAALKMVGAKPKPDVSEGDTKPATQSGIIQKAIAAITAALAAIAESFTTILGDWRVWLMIVVLALLCWIIWERAGKPDIRGVFPK